jgi:hypothetical protein
VSEPKRKDPDLIEFEERLANTHRGRLYSGAVDDQRRAVNMILHSIATGDVIRLTRWRSWYIRASTNCSLQLEQLERKDRWPA